MGVQENKLEVTKVVSLIQNGRKYNIGVSCPLKTDLHFLDYFFFCDGAPLTLMDGCMLSVILLVFVISDHCFICYLLNHFYHLLSIITILNLK